MVGNALLCLASGGLLVACGSGDSSTSTTGNPAKLLADGEPCYAAWISTTAYVGGNTASYGGRNYTAAYWTQGNNPSTNNGPAGSGQPWIAGFTCGGTTTTTKATTTTTKATTTTTKAVTTTTGTGTTTTTKATTTTTIGSGNCSAYVAGTSYAVGKVVTNAGGYYSCTVAGWCSLGASAYEPGVGWAWTSAWNTASASACGGTTSGTTSTTKASTTTTKATTTTTGASTTSSITTTTVASAIFGSPSVWTMRNDNSRSSAYTSERLLNKNNVNTGTFGKLFTLAADDQVYTTPLYLYDVNGTNVVYFASTNNTVYAYNADTGALLWSKNLNNGFRPFNKNDAAGFGACGGNYNDAAGNMGILGTPVIDVKTKTLYVVTKTVENGNFPQRLHALDITNNGAEKFGGPVVVGGSVAGTGDGGTTVNFNSKLANQRTGLALVNNVVYFGEASYCDYGQYHGWVMGFNASTMTQVAAWNASVNSRASGIWQAGQPPAVDGSGNVFVATGNGYGGDASNGVTNFSESVLKLKQNGNGSLGLASFWTPSNWAALDSVDDDQGSAGLLLLPGQNRFLQGGKDSIIHLMNANNLGGMGGANIQQFAATFSQNGGWKHIHGAPIYWNSATNGGLVYVWGEDDYLRTYKYSPTTNFNTTSFKVGTVLTPQVGYGMPGANLAISSLGNQAGTGVLWAYAVQDGNANQDSRPGVLYAYDADNAVTALWNSRQVASDDCGYLAKGTHPVVINGKVFLSSFGSATKNNSGRVCVYGLKANPALPAGTLPNYPTSFTGATQFAYNGSAWLNGGAIRLTDGRVNQGASAFFLQKLDVSKFKTNFSIQLSAGASIADGMTFTIQGVSPYAIGGPGGGLGVGVDPNPGASPATGIPKSVAIKFDVYGNTTEGANSTGIFTNGTAPTTPAITLPANIDLHSGHKFNVAMTYDGVNLTVTITDAVTAAATTNVYAVNIPNVVGSTKAYVGFTGGTGGITTTQDVLSFTYTN